SGLWWLLGTTAVIYTAMTAAAVTVLRSMARRWREGQQELPSPYAPQEPNRHYDPPSGSESS
ncbi:MAG: hypothetical protein L0H93_22650, partial [Nocardioides sp.]|nr:hypothetical protein [Nocardioides sp.]